ncbi:unnamed protein product [Ostreobium quekettii]|uniref:Tetratricopeptide repeat protein n=1 Tax=Ostreobium quekettii TaxID=121088 RepID=A0A8S1JG07_9CHLO|nr:unnamed protein product [Ostreobium quekettii]|eukprot:evm.model.scf_872.1 EVM.evm.TU.scf_872.1   scf_872:1065-5093(+)
MVVLVAPQVTHGNFTQTVYGYIRDQKLEAAITVLQNQWQRIPENRAALSLLGYCYYHLGSYPAAAEMYEQLVRLHPDNQDYRLYYAQSLCKSGMYAEATKAATAVKNRQAQVTALHFAVKYEQDDIPGEDNL